MFAPSAAALNGMDGVNRLIENGTRRHAVTHFPNCANALIADEA
jgi:hypothetical protein